MPVFMLVIYYQGYGDRLYFLYDFTNQIDTLIMIRATSWIKHEVFGIVNCQLPLFTGRGQKGYLRVRFPRGAWNQFNQIFENLTLTLTLGQLWGRGQGQGWGQGQVFEDLIELVPGSSRKTHSEVSFLATTKRKWRPVRPYTQGVRFRQNGLQNLIDSNLDQNSETFSDYEASQLDQVSLESAPLNAVVSEFECIQFFSGLFLHVFYAQRTVLCLFQFRSCRHIFERLCLSV